MHILIQPYDDGIRVRLRKSASMQVGHNKIVADFFFSACDSQAHVTFGLTLVRVHPQLCQYSSYLSDIYATMLDSSVVDFSTSIEAEINRWCHEYGYGPLETTIEN